jgi:hypothetical protein
VHPDQVIAGLAERQHNRVARRQLLARRITDGEVKARRASGHLHETRFRGVYAVGSPARSVRAGQMEALLAAGPGAALSHRSAAGFWGLLGQDAPPHHVILPVGGAASGLLPHRAKLPDREVVMRDGLRVTTPARVLLDVAETESERDVLRALGEAEALRLLTRRELVAGLHRWPGRRGVRVLRELLGDDLDSRPTRSVLEDAFLPLVKAAGLPMPATNHEVGGLVPDAVWPRHRVIVELDGRRFHDTPTRFERDRARAARLVAAGWVVLFFTWRRITREPMAVVAELTATLVQAESRRPRAA